MSYTCGHGPWYLGNGGKAVTVRSKQHWLLSKSLNPSEPQFPYLQNENSQSIYWVELLGRVRALTCKMLTNRCAQWPHLGPAGSLAFLSTFNTFGSLLGRAHGCLVSIFTFGSGIDSVSVGAVIPPLYRRGN